MQLDAYLHFSGQCEEAFSFYEKALGGKIAMKMTFAESPMADHVPPDFRHKIVHMRLDLGNRILMGSDATPDRYSPPKGFSLSLITKDAAESERLFNALSAGGKVIMPVAKTFWSLSFGMLEDRFGIPWMVNCDQPPTP